MIITLCGSTKFKNEYREVEKKLALDGHCVLTCNIFAHTDDIELAPEQRLRLENAHKQKINLSDAIFVINKNGYIGESTYSEIDWAQRMKKEIYFLEDIEKNEEENKENSKEEVTE